MNKISIALCTYNGEEHLIEQLSSIVTQTMLPDEIIICDDNSTDHSAEIARQFLTANFDGHFAIHQNAHNLGFSANFWQAISLCSGNIICLSDQDDIWMPDKVSTLVDTLMKHPHVMLAFHDVELVDGHLRLLHKSFWQTMNPVFNYSAFLENDYRRLFLGNTIQGSACAIRKELVEIASPLPPNVYHDEWLALTAIVNGGIFPIPRQLLKYRQENNTIGGLPLSPLQKAAKWTRARKQAAINHRKSLHHLDTVLNRFKSASFSKLDHKHAIALKKILQLTEHRTTFIQNPHRIAMFRPSLYFQTLDPTYAAKELIKDILCAENCPHDDISQ